MAIRVQPTGMAELFATAGKIAGEAERAERISAQLRSFAHQREMAKYAAEVQLARDKRILERGLEAEERAHQWQLEKMEMASRMDFVRDEQQRQKKLGEKQAKLDALDQALKEWRINKEDYKAAYLETVTDIPFYTQRQITERGAARPIQPRIPTETSEAVLEMMGYSPEERRALYRLPEPGTTVGTPTAPAEIPEGVPVGGYGPAFQTPEELARITRPRGGAGGTWGEPTAAPTTTPTEPIPIIRTDADWDALPSGTTYIDPTGQIRTKR